MADPEALLRRLGFRVRELTPIQWKRVQATPLILVDTDEGKLVLKFRTPPATTGARLRRSIADLELPTQAKVYEALGEQEFEWLRFPRLIETDGRDYLLLEYIETVPHGEHDLPREQLLHSLLEFQTAELHLPWRGTAALVARTRTPHSLLIRRLLTGIRSKMGWRTARAGLEAVASCRAAQPSLGRTFICHNDFHHNNLLLDGAGILYFSDFEGVTLEDRWLLADIIHFAVATQRFGIDTGVVADYHELLVRCTGLELDLAAQVRFGLLLRISKLVLSNVPAPEAVRRYAEFLEEVLLDDAAFGEWMAMEFGPAPLGI